MEKQCQLTCPFFIDDLTNRWADINNDGKNKPEGDWGYVGFDENGASIF